MSDHHPQCEWEGGGDCTCDVRAHRQPATPQEPRKPVAPDGTPVTAAGRALWDQVAHVAEPLDPFWITRIRAAILAIEAEAADLRVPEEGLLREIAASGVVHEAEPPGIDYVTIQVDPATWEAVKQAAAAPAASEDPACSKPPSRTAAELHGRVTTCAEHRSAAEIWPDGSMGCLHCCQVETSCDCTEAADLRVPAQGDVEVLRAYLESSDEPDAETIVAILTPAAPGLDVTLMRRTLVELHRILDGQRPDAAQIVAQYTREQVAEREYTRLRQEAGEDG